jgi:hypothetical protein
MTVFLTVSSIDVVWLSISYYSLYNPHAIHSLYPPAPTYFLHPGNVFMMAMYSFTIPTSAIMFLVDSAVPCLCNHLHRFHLLCSFIHLFSISWLCDSSLLSSHRRLVYFLVCIRWFSFMWLYNKALRCNKYVIRCELKAMHSGTAENTARRTRREISFLTMVDDFNQGQSVCGLVGIHHNTLLYFSRDFAISKFDIHFSHSLKMIFLCQFFMDW